MYFTVNTLQSSIHFTSKLLYCWHFKSFLVKSCDLARGKREKKVSESSSHAQFQAPHSDKFEILAKDGDLPMKTGRNRIWQNAGLGNGQESYLTKAMVLAPYPSSTLLITSGKEVQMAMETKKWSNRQPPQKWKDCEKNPAVVPGGKFPLMERTSLCGRGVSFWQRE